MCSLDALELFNKLVILPRPLSTSRSNFRLRHDSAIAANACEANQLSPTATVGAAMSSHFFQGDVSGIACTIATRIEPPPAPATPARMRAFELAERTRPRVIYLATSFSLFGAGEASAVCSASFVV